MIQIIAYRKYTDRLSNKEKTTDKLTEVRAPSVSDLFANLEKYLAEIEDREHYDLHYTLAECYESKRLFRKQKTWCIDIDDADVKRLDDYWAIVAKHTNLDPSVFGIVKSGGGLHFVWESLTYFAESVDRLGELRKNYHELCAKIQLDMEACALPGKVDNQVIRKSGTLRLPGTMNTKYDPPRLAELHKRDIIPVEFDIESLFPVEATRATISRDEARKFSTPHKEFIKEKCGFIQECFTHPEKQSEPAWFAALTIVSRFDAGGTECHTMSKGHPGYSFDDTEEKIQHAFNNSGPFTCDKISEISDKCKECPYYGKISSPITLQGSDFIATKETGFWFYKTDEKGNARPVKPDYEGLRRYFEWSHSYIVLESEQVYVWKKTHWEEMSDSWLKSFVQDQMDPKPSSGHVTEFVNLVKRTNLTKTQWVNDSIVRKLNLQNGVLCLETMTMLPHSMDYFFTATLPYAFDASAECPRFDRFMDEVTLRNQDMKATLLEFLGYAFSGMEYRWHKVLILPGDGSNGKSTFLNVIKALAGKTYSALLVNQIEDEKMRCNLVGKLFNVAEETPRKGLLDSSHFKILTSGGEYTARAVYSKPLEISNNRTKFMMACNELPAINDFSHGMIRRLMICPFEAVFTEGVNADTELDAKLRMELSGILNRVIQGYQRLLKANRFTLSQASIDAVAEYRDTADTVSMWSSEYLERSTREDLFVTSTDMYLSYKNFCSKLGIFTVSLQKFGRDIARLMGKKSDFRWVDGKAQRGYHGCKLRDQVGF